MSKTLFEDNPAKARREDPVQSYMAADRVNEGDKLSEQRGMTMYWLCGLQPCTAKRLDRAMVKYHSALRGLAHRRMRELETMGLVERKKKDDNGKNFKEMICSLTEKGEAWLRTR